MIIIVDYGMGNLGSIVNMLKKVGAKAVITSNPDDIKRAKKLILPGVGAFDNGMKNIHTLQLATVLHAKALEERIPILGVCLGMQLLTENSEEGTLPGLGWIPGRTIKFSTDGIKGKLRIPHMGWNTITINKKNKLLQSLNNNARFYFVHSYHVVCRDSKNVMATTNYGYDFASIIQKENIMGAQFHPEKSHKFGMQLLYNFVKV